MEINRMITNIWTVTVREEEVFDRLIDETIQEGKRTEAAPVKRGYTAGKGILASDDDRALLHRYYKEALAELSALLARRTNRVGGSINNTADTTTHMLTTVYSLAMTNNHESALLPALASHCLEFIIARLLEKWYGHGNDFGSQREKEEVRHIIHYRRYPIERPWSGL